MEHDQKLRDFLIRSTSEIGLSLTDENIQQFVRYIEQLLQWNKVMNLTSITNPQEIVCKHFVDSLTVLAAANFQANLTVIDVGTGAGFPGIPLKIIRNDLNFVLIEPTKKKCSFLRSVVGGLKLGNVTIFPGTLEQYVAQSVYIAGDILTVRALRFDEIYEQAKKALKSTGKAVLYRAEPFGDSQPPPGYSIEMEQSFILPMGQGNRVITVLAKSLPLAN